MTRQEFFDALKSFDWYYAMSDSFEVYDRGRQQARLLHDEAKQDPVKSLMMEMFRSYHHGLSQTKPTIEEFDL